MLNLILGAANSGKTQRIIDELARRANAGEDKLIVLVPDQASFATQKQLLEKLGPQLAAKVKTIRFNRLASEVFDKYGVSQRVLLGSTGKLMLMNSAIESVADQLTIFKKQVRKSDFAARMIDMYDELKYDTVTSEMLKNGSKSVTSVQLSNKLHDISLIYSAYEELLGEKFAGEVNSLQLACEILEKEDYFKGSTVFIDSFARFDNLKLRVIATMLKQCKDVFITLPTNNLDLPGQDISRFANVRKTGLLLKQCARDCGCPVAEDVKLPSNIAKPDLAAIEQNLYADRITPFSGDTSSVTVISATSLTEECEMVASLIRQSLRTGDYRLRDIAIIMRNEAYLEPIRRSLAKVDLPVFADTRKSVESEPLVLFLKYAYSAVTNGFQTDDVLGFLKTELSSKFDRDLTAKLERYVFVWQIGGVRKWSSEFTANPNGFKSEFSKRDTELLTEIEEYRKQVIAPLLTFKKQVNKGSVLDYCKATFNLIRAYGLDKGVFALAKRFESSGDTQSAIRQRSVYSAIVDTLDQTVLTMGEREIPFEHFSQLVLLALSNTTVGEIPAELDEIVVGDASRMRTASPKLAFVVGVNDGEFPCSRTDSGLFTQSDKVSLKDIGIDLGTDSEKMTVEEKFYAYCALTAPSEKLYLSYRNFNFTGEKCEPSDIVEQLKLIFGDLGGMTKAFKFASLLESEEQAFEYLCVHSEENTEEVQTLKAHFATSEAFADRYAALCRKLNQSAPEIKDKHLATKLYGEDIRMSATRFESFNKCPFAYFCNYGLGVKRLDPAQVDKRVSGLIVHFVMEKFIQNHAKENVWTLPFDTIRTEVAALVQEYVQHEMGVASEELTARTLSYVAKAEKIVLNTIVQTCLEFSQSQFVPSEFEYTIGSDTHPDYSVACQKGSVNVIGSIDRVDIMNHEGKDYIRVVDYKTGDKAFELYEIYHGLNAQMLIYLMSLGQSGTKYDGYKPSGVLYMHAANPGSTEVDRHSDREAIDRAVRSKFTMRGMVLNTQEVIEGMEKEIETSGRFVPVSHNEKKGYFGNLITEAQLQRVFEHINHKLSSMGDQLHAGVVADSPCVIGDKSPCDYCDYSSVCQHTPGVGDRAFESVTKFDKALEVFCKEESHEQ